MIPPFEVDRPTSCILLDHNLALMLIKKGDIHSFTKDAVGSRPVIASSYPSYTEHTLYFTADDQQVHFQLALTRRSAMASAVDPSWFLLDNI